MGLFGKKERLKPLDDIKRLPVVVSSANPDKVREIISVFLVPSIDLRPRPQDLQDIEEDGVTLEDNARLKALSATKHAGVAAVADDTGMFVNALDGLPGVRTARYAGQDATDARNIEKLLDALKGIEDRTAKFSTIALLMYPTGREVIAEGETFGVIAEEPRGTNGWGYDPVFIPEEGDGRTFAEMTNEEKHALSHRGRAFRLLAKKLNDAALV